MAATAHRAAGAVSPNGRADRAALETARILQAELRQRIAGEVRFDRGARMLYSTDASNQGNDYSDNSNQGNDSSTTDASNQGNDYSDSSNQGNDYSDNSNQGNDSSTAMP